MRRLNPYAPVVKARARGENLRRRAARNLIKKAMAGKKVDDKAKAAALKILKKYKRTAKQTKDLYKKKHELRKKEREVRAEKRKVKLESRGAPDAKKGKK